ncbi:hypothetical protein C0991_012316 [Blastosporella zonata]|nr:hypothetical protein C0991_012316 [Blastosporella zonata]
MAHFRCPTFDSLNNPIPNINILTLASHNELDRSPTLSPLLYPLETPLLVSRSRLDENDEFQSNAFSRSTSSHIQADLGLTYPRVSEEHAKADAQKLEMSLTGTIPSSYFQREAIKIELGDPTMGLQGELSYFYEPQIEPSWSFSSSLFNYTSSVFDATNSLNRCTTSYPDLNAGLKPDAFSSIATTSTMYVCGLADQLASSSSFVMEYPSSSSSDALHSSYPSGSSLLEELYDERPWPSIYKSEAPSPEISMFSDTWKEPTLSIDPSDISNDELSKSDASRALRLPGPYSYLEIPLQTLEGIFEMYPSPVCQTAVVSGNLEGGAHYEVLLPPKVDEDNDYILSGSEHEHNHWSSSSFPSPCRKRLPQILKRSRAVRTENPASPKRKERKAKQRIEVISEMLTQSPPVKVEDSGVGIDFGTPVLGAHKGIDREDLLSKAERYRLRNPGRVYDNTWCYVEGCTQTNKRRDHILIHVGSHLDQRPFPCAYCSARFLRKNECKRHEVSHSGVKPFVCDMCPNTAFARQDLLRRHSSRAHGINATRKRKGGIVKEEDQENKPITRPSKRVKKKGDM